MRLAPRLAAVVALAAAVAIAGCATPGGAPPAEGQADTVPVPREVPVHVDGTTSTGACVAAAANALCPYQESASAFHHLEDAGPFARLAGTLAWDAVAPTSQELTLYVARLVDGQTVWGPGDASATGTSPLAFDLDLRPYGDARLALVVGNGVVTPIPTGYVAVQAPQDFVLDATLTAA